MIPAQQRAAAPRRGPGMALAALLAWSGVAAAAPPASTAPAAAAAAHISTGRFGTVTVYRPAGEARSVAIFLSGDGGWELGVLDMARALTAAGAVVIGVDIRAYFGSLRRAAQRPGASCQSVAGDLESLSHQVQKVLGLREYAVPTLVGYSSGATVVYAALAESPPGTFAGALSLGFCAAQDFAGASLCPGTGLHYHENTHHELVLSPSASLRQPWIALQGQQDQVCPPQAVNEFAGAVAGGEVVSLPHVGHGFGVERNWLPQFRDAYARLSARPKSTPVAPATIGDLPVEAVPAAGGGSDMALLLTGDGGWAGLDQELAAALAARGVPTVALNSLKYFWTARTPEETARDVARLLEHYLAAWGRSRALLIGYSFGADVLPFVVNRLPAELRARIGSVSLLGIDAHAAFEVRVAEWAGADGDGPLTPPEVALLKGVPVLCIYGAGETDSICPNLPAGQAVSERVGTGHHFSGEYAALAERILSFSHRPRPAT